MECQSGSEFNRVDACPCVIADECIWSFSELPTTDRSAVNYRFTLHNDS